MKQNELLDQLKSKIEEAKKALGMGNHEVKDSVDNLIKEMNHLADEIKSSTEEKSDEATHKVADVINRVTDKIKEIGRK